MAAMADTAFSAQSPPGPGGRESPFDVPYYTLVVHNTTYIEASRAHAELYSVAATIYCVHNTRTRFEDDRGEGPQPWRPVEARAGKKDPVVVVVADGLASSSIQPPLNVTRASAAAVITKTQPQQQL